MRLTHLLQQRRARHAPRHVIGIRQDRTFRRRIRQVADKHFAFTDDPHHRRDRDAFGKCKRVLERVAARHQIDDRLHRSIGWNFVLARLQRRAAVKTVRDAEKERVGDEAFGLQALQQSPRRNRRAQP